MNTHTAAQPTTEFGVVYEDADLRIGMFEDELVRHQTDDMERATAVTIEALSKGQRTAICFREEGGEWLTMYSRQKPSSWIRGRRGVA